MKKVFITGGAGFIGTHIAELLLSRGMSVTIYDNLSTGRSEDIPLGAVFVHGNILKASALEDAMRGHDFVWHLAANAMIPAGSDDRSLDLRNNVLGTWKVLEAMRSVGIYQMIFASTAATYGDEPGKKLAETHGPMKPISLYGASKLAAEAFINAYSNLFGIEAWIFRFSNVVGGGMGHGVIFDLIQKLKKNPNELEIWGDGKGQKPYFLVEDCIRGMLAAYHGRSEVGFPNCDVYNLGCPTFTSVDNVAHIVIEEMGLKEVVLKHTGGRHGFPGDVPFVNYDPTKMEFWGWRVSKTSDEAVRIAARRIIKGER